MTPNPILKVLSTLRLHRVQFLLMGGQACILYGAAEFSRDTDITILSSDENLNRLDAAIEELRAEVIAVPPFRREFLEKGHAVHFRCSHPDAAGIRLDVMAKMRGVAPFLECWRRRTTVNLPNGGVVDCLSLPDLVSAKKTQRDKDWPQIRRLIEADFASGEVNPTAERVVLWLTEARSVDLLRQLRERFPVECEKLSATRSLLGLLGDNDDRAIDSALREEELGEREQDRVYWLPLRKELEALRHGGIYAT